MRPPETETEADAASPTRDGAGDPFSEAVAEQAALPVSDMLGLVQETARRMLEAEDALRVVRERFERAEDPALRGELAAEGLDEVERQLSLTRGRRQQLDSLEGDLWARRNRLERFLIHTRGRDWWQARRNLAQTQAPASNGT